MISIDKGYLIPMTLILTCVKVIISSNLKKDLYRVILKKILIIIYYLLKHYKQIKFEKHII